MAWPRACELADTAACSAGVLAWCAAEEAAIGSLSPGHEREVAGDVWRAGQQVLSPGLAGRPPGLAVRAVCGGVMAFCQRRRTRRKSEMAAGINAAYRGSSLAPRLTAACTLAFWISGQAAACLSGRRRRGRTSGSPAADSRTGG